MATWKAGEGVKDLAEAQRIMAGRLIEDASRIKKANRQGPFFEVVPIKNGGVEIKDAPHQTWSRKDLEIYNGEISISKKEGEVFCNARDGSVSPENAAVYKVLK